MTPKGSESDVRGWRDPGRPGTTFRIINTGKILTSDQLVEFLPVRGLGTRFAVGSRRLLSDRRRLPEARQGSPLREWKAPSSRRSLGWQRFLQPGSRTMKKGRRNRQFAKFARLRRHLEISLDALRPRRIRTRSARYAAALGEQLGLILRPKSCTWCRRHRRLERHHWDYEEPLNVTYLCCDCHAIADSMVSAAVTA
jgi:hypothetical protein